MNSVATATGGVAAFLGAAFMLVPRWLFGADDTGAAAIIFIVVLPVSIALLLSVRFPPHVLGPHESVRAIHGSVAYAVATGWLHGARTVLAVPTVAGTLSGLAAHRMVFGINTLAGVCHGAAQRHPERRGPGNRGAVLRRHRHRVIPGDRDHPGRHRPVGPLPHGQRGAASRGAHPARRRRPAAAGRWCCAGSCSARPVRWSSCAPTPPCRSTSTTHCAATCSPCRTRCSGCRSSSRSRPRRRSSPPTADSPGLVLAGSAVYLVGLAVHASVGRRAQAAELR